MKLLVLSSNSRYKATAFGFRKNPRYARTFHIRRTLYNKAIFLQRRLLAKGVFIALSSTLPQTTSSFAPSRPSLPLSSLAVTGVSNPRLTCPAASLL